MTAPARPWRRAMTGRDPGEEHRASTPLELLFDLTFVVAVSQASAELAHALATGDGAGHALVGFLMAFFAIWWGWMNFTWFASAYDIDDVPYRLLTLVQMLGVLVVAAAIPQAFEHQDFRWVVVGYVLMRVALVGQWLRAARSDRAHRAAALRYAGGVAAVQVLWVLFLLVPDGARLAAFAVLVVLELAVPVWAERPGMTPWHAEHVAERYGLFVIIVLGECILGATAAVERTLDSAHGFPTGLAVTGVGGLVLVFAVWWLYFLRPFPARLTHGPAQSFAWGYVHFGVFAALAALGSGLELAADSLGEHAEVSQAVVAWSVAVPTAAYLLLLALLGVVVLGATAREASGKVGSAVTVLIIAALTPPAPVAVLGAAVPVVALVVRGVREQHRAHLTVSSTETGGS